MTEAIETYSHLVAPPRLETSCDSCQLCQSDRCTKGNVYVIDSGKHKPLKSLMMLGLVQSIPVRVVDQLISNIMYVRPSLRLISSLGSCVLKE